MRSLVFIRNWPWPKVAALCGAWAIIVLAVWLFEFLRARPELAANDVVYRASFRVNVKGWLLLFGPIAFLLLLRWRAAS